MVIAKRTKKTGGERRGWRVVYYMAASGDQPVKDFVEAQSAGVRAALRKDFRRLREVNVALGMPYARKVAGRDFRELRTRVSGDIYRTFYFAVVGQRLVLLHGFQKKSEKTPARELETAEARMKDYLKRKREEK